MPELGQSTGAHHSNVCQMASDGPCFQSWIRYMYHEMNPLLRLPERKLTITFSYFQYSEDNWSFDLDMSCGSVQPSHHMNVHTNLKISALCVDISNRDIAIGELKCDTKYRPVFAQCNNSITPVCAFCWQQQCCALCCSWGKSSLWDQISAARRAGPG